MKRSRNSKQTVVITSVVVGVISMLIMNLIKNRLSKIPFFTRLFQLQDIGVNSMQDFLEVSELNLRVPDIELAGGIRVIYDGVSIEWDSDKSTEYIVFISTEYIHKIKLLDSDNIPTLKPKEIGKLSKSTNWIRKIYVRSPNISDDNDSSSENSDQESTNEETNEMVDSDEDNPEGIYSETPKRYNISAKLDTVTPRNPKLSKTNKSKHSKTNKSKTSFSLTDFKTKNKSKARPSDLAPTHCQIPFDKFNCRVRSSNGRVSRHLTYPQGFSPSTEEKQIEAWITKRGHNYYINVLEPEEKKAGQIFEYQVILYMHDGKGTVKTLAPFSSMKYGLNLPDKPVDKDAPISVKLGPLPSCLCYIVGIRGIGARFEQFISWIGEEQAMSLDGALDEYDMNNLQFAE